MPYIFVVYFTLTVSIFQVHLNIFEGRLEDEPAFCKMTISKAVVFIQNI